MRVNDIEPLACGVARRESVSGEWRIVEYDQVGSTNLVAAKLPAWHAVRALTQTAGRGRFQRTWVSDQGGLWLSAVVPLGADRAQNQTLPLVAGLSIIEAVRKLGVANARMRWPNDIMVGDRKLSGLLVDCFSPQLAVIGIGMNVANRPSDQDPLLSQTATRLADLLRQAPNIGALTENLLSCLQSNVEILLSRGFGVLSGRINTLWGGRRRVRVQLDASEGSGEFLGVDEMGRLLLEGARAEVRAFEPHEVRLLREI
jgi:BirA family biotin operon repressor/biotin-[acetyl-CoA-carboxylase] ligase